MVAHEKYIAVVFRGTDEIADWLDNLNVVPVPGPFGQEAAPGLRGHLAEFGVVAPKGPAHVGRLAAALEDPESGLPESVRELGSVLIDQILGLDSKIEGLEVDLRARAHEDEETARLMTIPGVGPVTAMALQAFAPPMESFRRGPRLLCMAGPGSAPEHDGREAAARAYIEDGPAGSQEVVDHGCHGGRSEGDATWRSFGPVAGRHDVAQADDAGRGCAGEQDGACRLGGDYDKGELPGSRRCLRQRRAEVVGDVSRSDET